MERSHTTLGRSLRAAFVLCALCTCAVNLASARPHRAPIPNPTGAPVSCPQTTVSAQIFDPQGFWYSFATIRISLTQTTSQPLCNGAPFGAGPFTVNTDQFGNFTLNLPQNTSITPSGTQWTFFVNGQANLGNPQPGGGFPVGVAEQTFSIAPQTLSSSSVNLSSTFNAASVSLTNICSSLYAVAHPGLFPSAICGTGGSAALCTATAPGTKDVNPQTCAGEWTLQGKSGNPTLANLTLLPASDQQAPNLFSGYTVGSFQNMAGGGGELGGGVTIANFFQEHWHLMNILNGGTKTGVSANGIEGTIGVVNEDNTGGGLNGILGVHAACDNTGKGPFNEQCVVAEAYNDSTNLAGGTFNFLDGASLFATDAGSAGNGPTNIASVFVGRAQSTNNNPNHSGLWIDSQFGCDPSGACAEWFTADNSSHLDVSGRMVTAGQHEALGYAIQTGARCIAANGTCSASFGSPVGAILTTIAAGATTVSVTNVHPFNGNNPQPHVQDDATLGTALSVTCNTANFLTYKITAKTSGQIIAAQVSIAAGGTGYVVNDTGTIAGGAGGTYQVTAVSSGAVTGISITAVGSGYTADGYVPVTTTHTSGVGTGLKLLIGDTLGSFTVTSSAAPTTNPACLSITIVNDYKLQPVY